MGLAGFASEGNVERPADALRPAMDLAMPEYLATVRHRDGRKVTENVVADSADEAVRCLREQGYDEVVLHNDDLMALFTRQREKAEHISPGDYLLFRNLPRGVGVFVVVARQGYRKMWLAMVPIALALAYLRYMGGPWGFWDWLCVAILLFPLTFGLVVALIGGRTRARYQQMLYALYWGRWEEALRRAEQIRAKLPAHEIPLRKAQALAALDRLDEALRLVEPFGDGKAVPGWFYHSMLAQVYEFARRRDEAIAQLEQAVELAPDNATMLISLARHIIWHKRDARRARALLTQARAHALSDMTGPFADLLEGLILVEEGRPRDGLPILEAAHKVFHARRHQSLGYLPLETTMLGLALAHAVLGESDRALKLYSKVRSRLVALRSHLVDRCDRAIGLPQDG
jgi:tetratricopeptide (TPR) repeat protein